MRKEGFGSLGMSIAILASGSGGGLLHGSRWQRIAGCGGNMMGSFLFSVFASLYLFGSECIIRR